MSKKFTVNKDQCIGCGACTAIAPEVFAMADDGLAENIHGDEVPNELEESAIEAQESCTVDAIKVEQN